MTVPPYVPSGDYASPFEDPAWYLTDEQYEAALAEWAATLTPQDRFVVPPDFLNRRPPMRSLPVEPYPEPEPEVPTEPAPEPQWFMCVGRRDSDGKPYIGLGVIEPDGTEREERYHPASNTRLFALIERYLREVPDDD